MSCRFRGCLGRVVLCLGVLAGIALAADESPRIPLDRWLAETPPRQEIPWRVRVLGPRLTYAQREMVLLQATVDMQRMQQTSVQRDVHVIARVGDGQGHWFTEPDYTHYAADRSVGKQLIQFTAALYLLPGRHQIAVLAYDTVLQQRSVTRLWVTVPPVKHDPLPQMAQYLPEAEFLPAGQVPSLSRAHLSLPLPTDRPVNIDLIVNFSPSSVYGGSMSVHRNNEGVFLEVAHVLTQLQVTNGCVWLTGVDVNDMRVLFERENAANLDWEKLRKTVTAVNGTSVDVGTLGRRTEAADFLRRALQRLFAAAPPPCPAADAGLPTLPVYIFAGSSMVFPLGTRIEPLAAESCDCRFYHLRGALYSADVWDEIAKIVKPVSAHRYFIDSPLAFRKALADIMIDIQRAATARTARRQ